MLSLITEDLYSIFLPPLANCYLISWGELNPKLLLWKGCNNTIVGSVCDYRYYLQRCYLIIIKLLKFIFLRPSLYEPVLACMRETFMIAYAGVCLRTSTLACVSLCVCMLLTSGLNLSVFPATGWAGKRQALSKISAVFTGMMGISGTFPTAVKSSAFPAPLNTPGSFLRPARVPIKQLRRLVFGNSCPLKDVINSRKTVFTVKGS